MELAFSTKSLRELCESEINARKGLGNRVAAKLKSRLADFRSATSIKDVAACKFYELDGEREQHMAVDLCDGFRLVICPNNRIVPLTKSGQVNWAAVSRIKIVGVENDEN